MAEWKDLGNKAKNLTLAGLGKARDLGESAKLNLDNVSEEENKKRAYAEIGKRFGYEYWERVDADHSGVRFCASWATKQEHVDALREAVNALKK